MMNKQITKDEVLYSKQYLFIKGFAMAKGFVNTLKALPVAQKLHDGQYRKGTTIVNGLEVTLPYLCHPLKVCSTLIALNLPMTDHELDLLYATALLHDVIEDGNFKDSDTELITDFGIDPEIYKLVKVLSKRSGLSQNELAVYFEEISHNKITALVKLSDRSHNVEDLYVFKNMHKYVAETRDFIYPMARNVKLTWPELSNGITILKSKIVSLTEAQEVIMEMYEQKIETLQNQLLQAQSK